MAKKLGPMHPGEVLREQFLVPLNVSAGTLAKVCGLPRTRIERIVSERTGITADTALRLAKALGTTTQLWLNLQNDYDIQIARRDLGKILDRIQTLDRREAARDLCSATVRQDLHLVDFPRRRSSRSERRPDLQLGVQRPSETETKRSVFSQAALAATPPAARTIRR